LRLLAALELKHRAATHLAFFTTALLSYADNGHPESYSSSSSSSSGADHARAVPLPAPGYATQTLLRALTATSKAVICKVGCQALQECQEGMGGVGYLDEPHDVEWNVSRLYRDTAANMTWEGTTNVLGSEVVRHLVKEKNLAVVEEWLRGALREIDGEQWGKGQVEGLWAAWEVLRERLRMGSGEGLGAVLADGRELMFSFAWVVSGVLLVRDAARDADDVARECARRWIAGDGGYGEWVLSDVKAAAAGAVGDQGSVASASVARETERRNWDCRIVWGCDLPADSALGYRPSQAKL
jgi:hypothetical protein